jgi:hypothetical protein
LILVIEMRCVSFAVGAEFLNKFLFRRNCFSGCQYVRSRWKAEVSNEHIKVSHGYWASWYYRVSQKLLCGKVPRTTLQFFLQQMFEMSPTGLKTCLDTLLHSAIGVLCYGRFQCCTPTAPTCRCSRLPYIPVHSNFWDTLYNHDSNSRSNRSTPIVSLRNTAEWKDCFHVWKSPVSVTEIV